MPNASTLILRHTEGTAGCYNTSRRFMIDNNLIYVVNTSITDKAKRFHHHHDQLFVYSTMWLQWSSKENGLTEKMDWKKRKRNLNMPGNCKRKKHGLEEDRFDDYMYQITWRTSNSYCNTNFMNLSSECRG
jgi:hypothetical protein